MKTAFLAPRSLGIGFRYLARGLIFAALAVTTSSLAQAADLGGNCCADLEDRIAELEATTARKGNRKISVTVYGTVDEAIMHIDGDGLNGKWAVGNNSNADTFIGLRGEAVVLPHLSAGYVLEIGVGGGTTGVGGLETKPLSALGSPFGGDDNGTYTRRSYGYVKSDQLGTVSVGLDYQATHGVSQVSVANTVPAARMLSLRPIFGPQIGEALDIFDGGRTNLIRYDSPTLYGAMVSASWSTGGINYGYGSINTGDAWDVALKWAGEGGGFRAAAAIGYREGVVIPTIGTIGSSDYLGVDPKVISGSASIKHIATGLFANVAAGQFDIGGDVGDHVDNFTAWTVQAGAEEKWLPIGTTTMFGEYADSDSGNLDLGLKYWGLGVVQHVDAAQMDVYASYRNYEAGFLGSDTKVDFLMAGVKIDF